VSVLQAVMLMSGDLQQQHEQTAHIGSRIS
jgi:hypothetical protein